MVSDTDIEILDAWLDGELSPAEQADLRRRLAAEAGLSAELAEMKAARHAEGFFFNLEPADDPAERILAGIYKRNSDRKVFAGHMRIYRALATAAACVGVGFLAGWMAHFAQKSNAGGLASTPVTYDVSITDDAGQLIGIQKFSSPDQAREFSQDLERSQERLRQLQSAPVTIRAAQF